ncbi:unannotated protein [freshwater metagenome]|uniref:Unannotated protein n=1 Tax=freshwater metagenome TaxID=449393 RepID=A0A6J7VMR7_9ZZZZ
MKEIVQLLVCENRPNSHIDCINNRYKDSPGVPEKRMFLIMDAADGNHGQPDSEKRQQIEGNCRSIDPSIKPRVIFLRLGEIETHVLILDLRSCFRGHVGSLSDSAFFTHFRISPPRLSNATDRLCRWRHGRSIQRTTHASGSCTPPDSSEVARSGHPYRPSLEARVLQMR